MRNNAVTGETVTITKTEYEGLKQKNEFLLQREAWLLEQLKLSRRRQFGTSSEKTDSAQISFFNEAEATADPKAEEPKLTTIKEHYRKSKTRLTTDKLPPDLPVEIVEHGLPESEQNCPDCGHSLHVMGHETREELKLVPAKAVLLRHVRSVYACRECEKHNDHVPIKKAVMPKPVIPGSFVSPEAIAHIAVQKFVMASPLYRQEQEWNRNGIQLSRQTMSNWLIRAANDWLAPIYNRLHELLCAGGVLHGDETTVQILHEPGKPAQSKSYMWLYRSSGDTENHIVLYDYQPDRKQERPQAFLKDFTGYLHTDGYDVYHKLPSNITVVGCWAHARRKFDEALKALAQKDQLGSQALHGLNFCNRLFRIEKQL